MNKNLIACMLGISGLALCTEGCVTDARDAGDPGDSAADTGTAESNITVCRKVEHFDYVNTGPVVHWDVTFEIGTGREFVDERPVGGRDKQYRVSPHWSDCPAPPEIVQLTHGNQVLIGVHRCLPDGRQEFHGSDFQRLLVPLVPFITYNCDP